MPKFQKFEGEKLSTIAVNFRHVAHEVSRSALQEKHKQYRPSCKTALSLIHFHFAKFLANSQILNFFEISKIAETLKNEV